MSIIKHSRQQERWPLRSRRLLRWFGPLLVVAGLLGFLVPPRLSLVSGAVAYNLFHIVAGLVAVAVLMTESQRAAATFNLAFGFIDLWQAVAGLFWIFPAELFALRPMDHVVHVIVGAGLVAVGGRALQALAGRQPATLQPGVRA